MSDHADAGWITWHAIETVAGRTRLDDAQSICNQLIQEAMLGSALRVAALTDVAIVWSNTSNGYQAIQRESVFQDPELILDKELSVAPALIRRALLGPFSSSFEQSKLLNTLALQAAQAKVGRDEKGSWLSWSKWCDEAGVRRQIKPQEQEALLEDLLKHALIEVKATGPKGKKYRITRAGELFLKAQTDRKHPRAP